MDRKIITLNIGKPKEHHWNGLVESSGIEKRPIKEGTLTKDGFIGDGIADIVHHGGPDRAVCVYPYEHYEKWEKEFQVSLAPPIFGENLTVSNMLESEIYIGDTFSIGEVIVQVTQGRVPCSTITKFTQIKPLLKRIVETGFTGYLMRVLKAGAIYENSSIELIERPKVKVSILEANHIMFHDRKNREKIEELLKVDELATVWKDSLNELLAKI